MRSTCEPESTGLSRSRETSPVASAKMRPNPKPWRLALVRRAGQESAMSYTAAVPPEDLIHDLTMSLWRNRSALRDLARRKTWEPSIDDCHRIAERQE